MPAPISDAQTRSVIAKPVTLITGFLGAGKTTVIKHLLQQPDIPATAVIVNEFGEIGLDDLLLEEAGKDAVLLKNGCICCSVRSDLALALQELPLRDFAGRRGCFEQVLIETTGLADPVPILHTLMTDPALIAQYRLNGVVTVLDAQNGAQTLQRHEEAVKQLAMADKILLTKGDIASDTAQASLAHLIADINRAAPLLPVHAGAVSVADIFNLSLYDATSKQLEVQRWLRAEAYEAPAAGLLQRRHSHEHARINSFCITREQPIAWTTLADWLETLARFGGEQLLRVKGVINVLEQPEYPVVIHGVQQVFHPPALLPRWPSDDRRSRIVLITCGLNQQTIDNILQVFETAARA